jgi:hypothetical protein
VERGAVQFHRNAQLRYGGVEMNGSEGEGDPVLLHEPRHPRTTQNPTDAPDLELALAALLDQSQELHQGASAW